ncbi:MAG: nucleotidyltransferase family protein [Candidatus Omnitrophota bacterium]
MENKKTSFEDRLIFLCAQIKTTTAQIDEIKEVLAHNLSWEHVIAVSSKHGVSPFLYYNLKKTDLSNLISKDIFGRLKNIYYLNLARNLKLLNEVYILIYSLRKNGIDVIPLKGACLLETVYKDPGLRRIADIDILVKEKDLDKLRENMPNEYIEWECADLTQKKKHTNFTRSITKFLKLHLDVHTNISNLSMPRPHKIDIPLWDRAEIYDINGKDIYFLSKEDTFLNLAIHLRRHTRVATLKLKYLQDIAELLKAYGKDFDWRYILRMAKKNNIKNAVFYALFICKKFFGVSVNEEVFFSLRPNSLIVKIMDILLNKETFFKLKPWHGVILRLLMFDRFYYVFCYLHIIVFRKWD